MEDNLKEVSRVRYISGLLNVFVLDLLGSKYFIAAILPALLTAAAGACITYLLGKLRNKDTAKNAENENCDKFGKHWDEAVEHIVLAHSYEDGGEIQRLSDELKEAANCFLRASVYADAANRNRCEILANNLFRQSKRIRKFIIEE